MIWVILAGTLHMAADGYRPTAGLNMCTQRPAVVLNSRTLPSAELQAH